MDAWVVVLTGGVASDTTRWVGMPPGVRAVYVIPEGEQAARDFADYLTAEVDPAVAVRASSPTQELLAWRRMILSEKSEGRDTRHG